MILEQKLLERLEAAKISVGTFAVVARIDATRLSKAFSGKQDLSNELILRLLELATYLSQLVDAVKPLHLPLKDAQALRALVEGLQKQNVSFDAVRAAMQVFPE